MRTAAVAAVMLAAACRNGPPRPLEIEASDMCTRCKMAISEKRYAAEWADAGGVVRKFDDLGCLLRFAQARGGMEKTAAVFVVDYDSKTWLDGRNAWYVQAASIPSPMSGGIIAVAGQAAAGRHAAAFQGQVLKFEELWNLPQ